MKNITKRTMSLLFALALVLSLLPTTALAADNVTYVKNWGVRDQIATTPSENVETFYTGENTYENWSQLSGAADTSATPSSALYTALGAFMASKHTIKNSYNSAAELFAYTDCVAEGDTISTFYSAVEFAPGEAGLSREHTWPDSKGLEGADEDDIMMLRPVPTSENSGRGNTAYGESKGFFDPNESNQNIRGDVARIMLYQYVRWGNTAYMWGSAGVLESKEILLKWMEEDPVDTWELGRNDSVQSITGTRNVFVDYPELAFALFDEEVPDNYSTPTNVVSGNTVTATFRQQGTAVKTETVEKGDVITLPAYVGALPEDYTFIGWVLTTCNDTENRPAFHAAGSTYSVTANATFHALYSFEEEGASGVSTTYKKVTTAPADWSGDYVITYDSSTTKTDRILKANASDPSATAAAITLANSGMTRTGDELSGVSADYVVTIAKTSDEKYTIKVTNATSTKYLSPGTSSSKNTLTTSATVNNYTKWTLAMENGKVVITNVQYASDKRQLEYNTTGYFRCYKNTQKDVNLYAAVSGATTVTYYTTGGCLHEDTKNLAEIPAKCGVTGNEAGVFCYGCNTYRSGGAVIPALQHSMVAGAVTPPTILEQGYTTYTCQNGCGHTEQRDFVEPLGADFTVSFAVPEGVEAVESMTINSNTGAQLPTAGVPAGDVEYTFVGWTTEEVEDTETLPTVLTGTYKPKANITLYPVYSYEVVDESETTSTWQLVTSTSALAGGDRIVFACNTKNAVAGDLGSNTYMPSVTATFSSDKKTIPTMPTSAVIMTVGKSGSNWTFANASGKKLGDSGASSSQKLYWGSGTTTWAVTIASTGNATVANSSVTSNKLWYNASSPRFKTYSSNQTAIQIYKEVVTSGVATTYYTSAEAVAPITPEQPLVPIALKGYNLTLGNSLSINFNVTQEVMDQYEDVYMVFQVEGRDPVKVTEYFVRQNSDTDIRYNFAFDGVSILDLNVPVLATVYGTFNGVEYSYTAKNAVSVLSYCNSKIANGADDPETAGVCANLLKYAIAAEAYMNAQYGTATDGHLVNILTDAQLAAIETYATPDDQVNVEKTSSHTEGTKVKFSNQSLEMVSRITLRYKITILESGLDTSKLTFKVTYTDYNGNAACQDYTFEDLEYDAKTGEYVLSFSGFNATQMKELAKCTIYIDGVEHCYYANSIENYCCTAINSSKQPEVVKYLAKRISLYGDACYAAYGK